MRFSIKVMFLLNPVPSYSIEATILFIIQYIIGMGLLSTTIIWRDLLNVLLLKVGKRDFGKIQK